MYRNICIYTDTYIYIYTYTYISSYLDVAIESLTAPSDAGSSLKATRSIFSSRESFFLFRALFATFGASGAPPPPRRRQRQMQSKASKANVTETTDRSTATATGCCFVS